MIRWKSVVLGVIGALASVGVACAEDLGFETMSCVAEASNPTVIREAFVSSPENRIDLRIVKNGQELRRSFQLTKKIKGETRISIFGAKAEDTEGHWVQITYDPQGVYRAIIVTELDDGRLPCVMK